MGQRDGGKVSWKQQEAGGGCEEAWSRRVAMRWRQNGSGSTSLWQRHDTGFYGVGGSTQNVGGSAWEGHLDPDGDGDTEALLRSRLDYGADTEWTSMMEPRQDGSSPPRTSPFRLPVSRSTCLQWHEHGKTNPTWNPKVQHKPYGPN